MLISGHQLRLTNKERAQLRLLTGTDPGHVKTSQELKNYIEAHTTGGNYCRAEACLACRLLNSYLPQGNSDQAPLAGCSGF